MADHHAAGHASPDDEYLETPPGAEYEHTDANVWVIVKFLVWLTVSAVVIHFGLGLMYGFLIEQSKETGTQRYPMASPAGERREGIVAINARKTELTDSPSLNTRATSGFRSIATDPGCVR